MVLGEEWEGPARRKKRECKNLNKTWTDLKQLDQSRVRWRVGVVPVGIKKTKKKKKSAPGRL